MQIKQCAMQNTVVLTEKKCTEMCGKYISLDTTIYRSISETFLQQTNKSSGLADYIQMLFYADRKELIQQALQQAQQQQNLLPSLLYFII